MSIDNRPKNSMYQHLLVQEYVIFNVKINSNATPASKILESDIPGVAILRTQGQTAAADAVDSSITWTAPVDADGTFGLLLDEQVSKIYAVAVTPSVGTVAVTSAISSEGHLYLELNSNQDFSSTSVQFLVELKYIHKI
jgi:hypothetical protein